MPKLATRCWCWSYHARRPATARSAIRLCPRSHATTFLTTAWARLREELPIARSLRATGGLAPCITTKAIVCDVSGLILVVKSTHGEEHPYEIVRRAAGVKLFPPSAIASRSPRPTHITAIILRCSRTHIETLNTTFIPSQSLARGSCTKHTPYYTRSLSSSRLSPSFHYECNMRNFHTAPPHLTVVRSTTIPCSTSV